MDTNLQNLTFLEQIKQRLYLNNGLTSNIDWNNSYRTKTFSDKERIRIVMEGQSGKQAIQKICVREGISPNVFYQWTHEFLENNYTQSRTKSFKELEDDDKFRVVIEGKSGETSIAEICNRENISHDTFFEWCQKFLDLRKNKSENLQEKNLNFRKSELLFSKISNLDTFNYLKNFVDFTNQDQLVIAKSNSIKLSKVNKINTIICLENVNNIRYINKYFEKINSKLMDGGLFVGCLETFSARRQRMPISKIPILNNLYFGIDFFVKRIAPKLNISQKIYFNLTKGKGRLLSKAESLGRLVSSGFKIMDYKTINGLLYFVVKKENEPVFDLNPSYGPIFKMSRLGKGGEIIKVYKFRTMHPYSEYLQDYVLKANGYAKTGKPADDFRIPIWGRFMRRFWLDELPQLINVLKGEMKLVGIRPVSERYFQDIPKEMQKLRLTQKPGCIPPYVSLNRKANVMSVLQAEKDYLEEKIKNPYFTDTKYFFYAVYNILFKHKRSA